MGIPSLTIWMCRLLVCRGLWCDVSIVDASGEVMGREAKTTRMYRMKGNIMRVLIILFKAGIYI
jgi:hypothetical protein